MDLRKTHHVFPRSSPRGGDDLNFLEKQILGSLESFDYMMLERESKLNENDILDRLPDIIKDRYIKDVEEEELRKSEVEKQYEDERLKKKGLIRVKNNASDRREGMRDKLRKRLLSRYQ
jgi:hypothetical protein